MMANATNPIRENTDAELVALSRTGDRDAFGRIVARYQSLVCSLAYNATGSLAQSEDLAQETFIAAWKQLGEVREPEKLRPWLCGITRNLINNHFRRQGREPSESGEPIDAASELPTLSPQPAEAAISREEEAILWRSLQKIPGIYREPMILFYREQQSVERVAQALELSEDAVKQRLARGRKLLHEQVAAFVEGALRQSTPGRAFTFGVLAALPLYATSAKAATVGALAAKGSTLASATGVVAVFNLLLGPFVGLLGAYFGARAGIESARTPRELQYVVRSIKRAIVSMLLVNGAFAVFILAATTWWSVHPVFFAISSTIFGALYTGLIVVGAFQFNRKRQQVYEEEKRQHPELFAAAEADTQVWEYRSRAKFLGLPLVHVRSGQLPGKKRRPAVGWIAVGDCAYGVLFAAGGFAVGGISMGGASIGLVSMGGAAVGGLAFGGFALGGVAIGGAAIGLLAAGGFATGWFWANGGLAVAHEFALGGQALARHANDLAAGQYFARHPWLDLRRSECRTVLVILCWMPVFIFVLEQWRRKKRRSVPL